MRTLSALALTTLVAASLSAQGNPADPDKKAAGTGAVPTGWGFRLESPTAKIDDVKFVTMGSGLHFTSGPSGIYWKDADAVPGSFHTIATFTQTKAPTHPEAFGLFVAGKDLKGAGASYVYLIVRGDGMYSIRQGGAAGAEPTNLTTGGNANGWLANAAVVKQNAAGVAKNTLEVSGDAKTKKLTFKINGTTVGEIDAPGGSVAGLVGIRMNHNLDVHVDGFGVHKL